MIKKSPASQVAFVRWKLAYRNTIPQSSCWCYLRGLGSLLWSVLPSSPCKCSLLVIVVNLLENQHEYRAGLGIRSFDFQANHSYFAQKWAKERFAQKNKRFTHSLIFSEWPERFAHDRSFPLSDVSKLLIFGELPERFAHISHLIWAKWAIRSHCSEEMSDCERITHIAHQKRGNEWKWAIHSFFNNFFLSYIKHTKNKIYKSKLNLVVNFLLKCKK